MRRVDINQLLNELNKAAGLVFTMLLTVTREGMGNVWNLDCPELQALYNSFGQHKDYKKVRDADNDFILKDCILVQQQMSLYETDGLGCEWVFRAFLQGRKEKGTPSTLLPHRILRGSQQSD